MTKTKQGPCFHGASSSVGETNSKKQEFHVISAVKTTKHGECNRKRGGEGVANVDMFPREA